MIRFRHALLASALVLSLGLPLAGAQAQGGPPATQGPGYGRGYGMMSGGYGPAMMGAYGGYGPGMMIGGGGAAGYGPGMMWGWRGGWSSDPKAADDFVQRRLAFEKAGLKITAQQSPLWEKYAETVRANAKAMVAQRSVLASRDGSQDSLPDRLQIREELLAVQADSMRKENAALRPLYAALDANQKALADDFMGFGAGPGMF